MISQPIIKTPEGEWKWQWYGLDVHLSSELIFNAISLLRPSAFIVWLDLSMGIDFTGKLTFKRFKELYEMSYTTYKSALEQLEEKGFLICENKELGIYNFVPDAQASLSHIPEEVFEEHRAKQKQIIAIGTDKTLTEEERNAALERLCSN